MTWLRYFAFIAAAVFLRAFVARFSSHPDQWLLVGLLALGLALIVYDRGRWQSLIDRAGRATGPELDALQASISVEERAALQSQGLPLPSDALAELHGAETFFYPPGSPTLLALLCGACLLFGVSMLVPLARGRLEDPANDWMLFIVGLLFLAAARGYWVMATFVGKAIHVDQDGIRETSRSGHTTRVGWRSLRRAHPRRWSGGFLFQDASGDTIAVSPRLRGYTRFLFRIVAQLRILTSAS